MLVKPTEEQFLEIYLTPIREIYLQTIDVMGWEWDSMLLHHTAYGGIDFNFGKAFVVLISKPLEGRRAKWIFTNNDYHYAHLNEPAYDTIAKYRVRGPRFSVHRRAVTGWDVVCGP